MSFTDVNAHTKKIVSDKIEKSMGKISVTTHERSAMNLEKTFSLEATRSVLCPEKNDQINNKSYFVEEIEPAKINQANNQDRIINKKEEIHAAENKCLKALKTDKNAENTEIVNVPSISSEAIQMINALMHTQTHIVQELTEVFDKRLEKFDDLVLDLIRCKTENERLKQKVDNLTRDNYKYKKDIESFRSVIPGIYIKKELDKTKF